MYLVRLPRIDLAADVKNARLNGFYLVREVQEARSPTLVSAYPLVSGQIYLRGRTGTDDSVTQGSLAGRGGRWAR